MAKRVLVDSGYWIALLTKSDGNHVAAQVLEADLEIHRLLIPWPTLFEFVDTRLSRRPLDAQRFRKILFREGNELVDDRPYREQSLNFTLENKGHTYSLVDHILRSVMEDATVSVDAFVGFNHGDFYDVCAKRGIEMLPD